MGAANDEPSQPNPIRLAGALALWMFQWGIEFPALARQATPPQACSAEGGSAAKVTGVDQRGELTLADGRIVKLAGIDTPIATSERPQLANLARGALSEWLSGHDVILRPVLPTPDRWGRTVAHVFAPPEFGAADVGPPISAAAVLIDAGLARAKPAPEARDCIAALVAGEADARRDRLGLWADPYYAVVDALDSVRLAARAGTFVLIQGQVTRVGYGRTRTYVNFGPRRDSFSITILKRNSGTIDAAGLSLGSLVGVRLRVRGVLDTRFGPQIQVSDPHDFERL